MFLKQLKEKSNKKFVEKVLNSRVNPINDTVVKSVGIILNEEEFDNKEYLKALLLKTFNINQNSIKIITFVKNGKSQTLHSWDSCFTPKQIGWKGKIYNVEIQDFVNTKFDILINYYRNNDSQLNLVSALSLAKFRVGISSKNLRLNDFIIDVKTKETILFIEELEKYLKIFNKI